jgi:tetratricopeptide (TPR) repeat protein
VLFVTGNYQESIDLYKSAINLNKNIPDLFLFMGYNYKALEDYDQAVQAFLQANALNPADAIPDLELSRTYAAVGDFGKAVQFAEGAVKDEPENPHRYGNLGMMYYENGEMDKSIDVLALAIRGGTTTGGVVVKGLPLDYGRVAMYYWYYGFALAKVTPNRCSEAIPIFQALLTGVPEDSIAIENATVGLGICEANLQTPTVEGEVTPTPR